MIKYAKTKDNKIIKIDTENDVFTSKYEIVGEPKNTIEELSDENVIDKRLTKKYHNIYKYNFDTNCDSETRELRSIETHNKIVDKLGRYEDIEEKIGCPIDLYFKMCVFGTELYSRPHIDVVQYHHIYKYSIEHKCFCLNVRGQLTPLYYVKDYGKTWAITREELN